MKYSTLAAIALLLPNIAAAQIPGTTVVATPRLRNIRMAGDTTIVTYSVLVSSTSPEHLFGFTISVAGAVTTVVSPGVDSVWTATKVFEGHQVAGWWSASTISPGDSTPTLVYKAIGVPGMSTAWLTGDGVTKPWAADSNNPPAYEWLGSMSATTSTAIGVYSAAISQPSVSSYLRAETDAACTAGWVTSSSLCTALHGFATTAYSSIQQYRTSLDSARSAGSAVTDAAYWLLTINQSYALAHTTPPALNVYIAGDTATSTYTAHASGGTPSYSYYWEWCAIACGGGALRTPASAPAAIVRPNTVTQGWNNVGSTTASICWAMSQSTLRVTITDANSSQAVAYFTVPVVQHVCGGP